MLKRKMELIWLLVWEGYTDIEIGKIMNGTDRSWIYRIRKRMPNDWEPRLEKIQLLK